MAPAGRFSGEPGWLSQTTFDKLRQHVFERCPFQGRFGLHLAEKVIGQIQRRSHKHIFASKHFNVKRWGGRSAGTTGVSNVSLAGIGLKAADRNVAHFEG